MGAAMAIIKEFGINIDIPLNKFVSHTPRSLQHGAMADSLVSCKSNPDLYAFLKAKTRPLEPGKK